MKLAIDTNCRRVTLAGTTRYLNGLLRGFSSIPDLSICEIEWDRDNLTYKQPARALKTFYRELYWARFIGPQKIRNYGVDIFHSPGGFLIIPPRGVARVTTLLDLAILRYPKRYRSWQRFTGSMKLKQGIKHYNKFISISSFTADEAMRLLDIPAKNIEVIHLGCDFQESSLEIMPQAISIPEEFFLFVGSLEPGKNLELLRQVYLLSELMGKPLPPLVVVGVRWEGVAREGEWPKSWIAAGRIPDVNLVYLYRRALALVFPSIYEGFGFPPLEAMTLACPVICSSVASIPEVTGSAALYCELNPDAYLNAMIRLVEDDQLRDELISKGLLQASKFSWDKCAEETYKVYKSLV